LNASGILQSYTATATGGTSSTIVFPAGASAVNDFYNSQTIKVTIGAGIGQVRLISDYVGATRTATVTPAYSVSPNNTSTFVTASIVAPGVLKFQGNVLYLENRRPIVRAIDQAENIKIVVSF
jgi:hypothetical protein